MEGKAVSAVPRREKQAGSLTPAAMSNGVSRGGFDIGLMSSALAAKNENNDRNLQEDNGGLRGSATESRLEESCMH